MQVLKFYIKWALYHWATIPQRRLYFKRLGNLEYCERDYYSYLEFKGFNYPFDNFEQHDNNCKKIRKQNFKETAKMRLGHQKIIKRNRLIREIAEIKRKTELMRKERLGL